MQIVKIKCGVIDKNMKKRLMKFAEVELVWDARIWDARIRKITQKSVHFESYFSLKSLLSIELSRCLLLKRASASSKSGIGISVLSICSSDCG